MPDTPPAPTSEPLKRSTFWILALITTLLTINWIAAVARFQVNVPIWDQWDFLTPLFNGEGALALFNYQHGPHRQGIAFIFSSWVMSASHWDSRVESLWMVTLLTTTAILALWLKKRLSGSLGPIDTCIPVLILTLTQWGSVISVPNASHSVFPLLLGVLSVHCWIAANPATRFLASSILAAFSIFTGFAIFNGVVLTVLLAGNLLRAAAGGKKSELGWISLSVTITALSWILFLRSYQFNPASDGYHFPHTPVFDYARFLALMFAHPAGWDQSTLIAQTTGGVLLGSCLGVFSVTVFRSFRDKPRSRSNESVILLLGSGLAFAAFTAVGRIHLGISAGMAPRYVTLLIPLWLGLYFWGTSQTRPAFRYGTTLLVGLVTLLPFTHLAQRPVAAWLGTAGLTNASLSRLSDSTNEKMAWVSTYLRSDDIREADRIAGRLIHPAGESIGLDRKLTWLKSQKLSFFKSAASPNAWRPWWPEDRSTWLRTHDPEGSERWMANDCSLWLTTEHEGFVNFRVVQKAPTLPGDPQLEITHRGLKGSEPAEFLRETISLPITRGEQLTSLRSTTGSTPAHPPTDNRLISYRLSDPWITRQPAGIEWTPSTSEQGEATWTPRYRWRVVSGFHGWEYPASFGWSDARLEIEILSSEAVFLNIQIDKRYHPVASGPVIISVEGRRIEIPNPDNHPSFSIQVSATSAPNLIQIENVAGASSPQTSEGKADSRQLAIRFSHLSLSPNPIFSVLNNVR